VLLLDEYQRLVDANEKLKECKERASSRQSIAELAEWLNKGAQKSEYGQSDLFTTISWLDQNEVTGLLLPEAGMMTGRVGNELTGP
jgi:hypothetical protein